MQFSLYRQGVTGDIRFIGEFHCGTLPINRIRWESWLHSEVLADDGFIADGKYSAEFFDNLHTTAASCELIAQQAARYILERAPNATKCIVRINGVNQRSGYAECVLEQTPQYVNTHGQYCRIRGK